MVTRDCLCLCVSVCLCVCLSAAVCPHYCKDPDVTWESGRDYPLVVHYWADLQSGHGLRYYSNIARTRNLSECMLVLALYLKFVFQDLSEPNRACLVGVYAVTLAPYIPYME